MTRNYSDLLGLVTGSRQAPTAATTTSINSLVRAGAYNINGERSVFNNFLLDGIDNNSYGESNQGFDNQIIAIPPDSVAQFQVVTNNESAEYGRSSGATINVASRGGTNHFPRHRVRVLSQHRSERPRLFQTHPQRNFRHLRSVQEADLQPQPVRRQLRRSPHRSASQHARSPLLLCRLRRFPPGAEAAQRALPAYAERAQRHPGRARSQPAYRQGLRARHRHSDRRHQPGLAADHQRLPPGFESARIGLATTGLAQYDYNVQVPFTDNSDKGDLRLDFQQNAQTSWFVRVSDRKEDALNAPALPLPLDGQTNGRIRVLDQQAVLGYTHLYGSDKVLDARVAISRTKAGKFSTSIGSTSFPIPGEPTDPSVAGGLPTTSITGFTGFGRQSTNPQFQNPALLDPKINFTIVKGKHSLKFGYEYEHLWEGISDNNPLFGSFTYGGGYSLCPAGTTLAGSRPARPTAPPPYRAPRR